MGTEKSSSLDHPTVTHSVVGRSLKAVTVANQLISASVLIDQGADIHALVYRPLGVDVLWKPPRMPREPGLGPPPTGDSLVQWISYYRGGWNLIFPNFGSAVTYRGALLEFHGEAARIPWQLGLVEATETGARIEAEVALQRSPFRIRRVISVAAQKPELTVLETVTNEGDEPMECMWAHHPAFGAPLVSSECVIETDAEAIESDDSHNVSGNDLPLGKEWAWPHVTSKAGEPVDLSQMPSPNSHYSRILYLKAFARGRYSLTNRRLGLGLEVCWDATIFPYATFWQETGGARDYPFYGKAYVMAIEPSSSYPVQGLITALEKTKTHMTFKPGEEKTTQIRVTFFRP